MESLPVELLQIIAFMTGLDVASVLAFASTSKALRAMILGPLGSLNKFDVDQLWALNGVGPCVIAGHWRATLLAIKRGYGDPLGNHNPLGLVFLFTPKTYFSFACSSGDERLVAEFLNAGVDPSKYKSQAFVYAAAAGNVRIMEMLLQYPGVDPSSKNDRAIEAAVEENERDAILFLARDPRVKKVREATKFAVLHKDWELLDVLIQRDDFDLDFAVSVSAGMGDEFVFERILSDPRLDYSLGDWTRVMRTVGIQFFGNPRPEISEEVRNEVLRAWDAGDIHTARMTWDNFYESVVFAGHS